jgi:hypothetical protein
VTTPGARWGVGQAASVAATEDSGDALAAVHARLASHFRDLRERRDVLGCDVPVFALEHGLSDTELVELEAAVRSAVRRHVSSSESWLPLVIYAAELGYRYSGDEYWQTFEAQTPGWAEGGDRSYIRTVSEKFSDTFGGARPSGAWATWFSIISWPITHAVLPADLQRQFARLLFESRATLTAELLADPDALGLKLAARAGHYSSRFQSFAQNTGLLGQVTTALLADEGEESPYLLQSTLRRIASSVSAERQQRKWLQETRRSARQILARGFQRPAHGRSGPAALRQPGLPRATDPVLSLRCGSGGWSVWLSLPDMSVLAERLPSVHGEFGRLRPQLAGAARAPLPRGQLLFPGQPVLLATWPDGHAPLIQLEGSRPGTNALLASECTLPPGPPWVFRFRDTGIATEIRSKIIHPGGHYVLLRPDAIELACLPGWVTPAECRTGGIQAYNVCVPPVVGDRQVGEAQALGLTLQADVSIRPAGMVAAGWDGEGTASWLSGEDVILAIHSTRSISHCIFEVAGVSQVLEWPAASNEIFVTVTGLSSGAHEARVSLVAGGSGELTVRGTFVVIVRDPSSRPPGGTLREGLALITSPAAPTLPEIWDCRADVEVAGPVGIRARVGIALTDRHHRVIASRDFFLKIPLEARDWRRFTATRLRGSPALRAAYDDAESCVITVSDHRLGLAELRCEREFAPLRWIVGIYHDDPVARLIDNTEDGGAAVSYYQFSSPDQPAQITPGADGRIRDPAGGLLKAQAVGFETAVILPPKIRSLADFQDAGALPRIRSGPSTPAEIRQLVDVARMWASAALPANPLAQHERCSVLRAVTSHLVCLVSGRYWAELEQRARKDIPAVSAMQHAVGTAEYQKALARAIADRLNTWKARRPEERASDLGVLLNRHVPRASLGAEPARRAELLLRLASDPATVSAWPQDEVSAAIEQTIVIPALMRATRFVVLAIHTATEEDTGTTYRGWEWT